MAAKKKAAAKKTEGCNCADEIDALLKPKNGVLVGSMRLNPGPRRVYLAVEKLDTAVRTKPPSYIPANYCPFCGKKAPA